MTQQLATRDTNPFEWVDLTNPSQQELEALAQQYNLYPTIVKDCLEPDHLPKFEAINEVSFVITRLYHPAKDKDADTIQELTSKIAIFYGNDFVLTVHRWEQPLLQTVKTQFVDNHKCRSTSALALHIVQSTLTSYLDPGLKLANDLDAYESTIFLQKRAPNVLQQLYYLKRKASAARRLLSLSQDILNAVRRIEGQSPLLQDTQDLLVKLETLYTQLEESASHLLDIYLSLASQRTNEVMRVLTVFSAFFLPLTFIVGVYGMNFKYMPELDWHLGYSAVWLLMITVTLCVFVWFKRKGWI